MNCYRTNLHVCCICMYSLFFRGNSKMLNILLMLASLWAVGSTQVTLQQQTCSDASQKATIKPGAEALIGGLFSMHYEGTGGYGCGPATLYSKDISVLINKFAWIMRVEYHFQQYMPWYFCFIFWGSV